MSTPGLSQRAIAARAGVSHVAVLKALRRGALDPAPGVGIDPNGRGHGSGLKGTPGRLPLRR
jgi:hypothetical protein